MEHEDARHHVEASVRGRDRFRVADEEIDPRPPADVTLGVPDVRLR